MQSAVRNLVPLAFVRSVPRSIDFYARFGFQVRNTHTPEGRAEPSWAWLDSGRGALMVSFAEKTAVPERQSILFYLYVDDVVRFREQLQASGVSASEITFPVYSPEGEFQVTDPDGYELFISHT